MTIENATPADAAEIAGAIMMALGEDTCREFSSGDLNLQQIHELFRRCAEKEDSQYSWRNTLVARDDDGKAIGFAISYDGEKLHGLRRRFLDEYENMAGYRIDQLMTDETTPDEWYLDTLAVLPQARRKGVAGALINSVARRAEENGKPVGLLVDKENLNAQKFYQAVGFKPDGERPFAGEMMFHRILRP